MKPNRWKYVRVVPVLAALIAAVACGGSTPATSSAPAAIPSATANQVKSVPRDRVQDGGTFTWPLNEMPPTFNYNHLDGTSQDNKWVVAALFPFTYGTDEGGTPIWNRDYLASEPTIVRDPKQIVTFRINPKAIWYDGTPITWEDFYWQWRAQNGTDKRYRVSASNGFEDIESVARGSDDREVVVTFEHPFADWPSIFYMIYPASTNKDPKIFNDGWKDRPLTSAGPFRLGDINRTTKTITLVRNEKWWGAPAKLDRIVFRVMERDAEIDALANGELDALDIGADANKYVRAKALSQIELRTAGGPNFRHITINGSAPNLQDVRVRKGVAMAINRAAIVRALLGPVGVETTPLNNHIFMKNQAGYRDNAGDVGRYDPEAAKRLLDEAGWHADGNVRKKAGRSLELNLVIPSGIAAVRQEAELIQNMLAQVGATVRIDTVPAQDFFDKYIIPGQFDMTVFSWMGTAYPISSSKSIYAKPTMNPQGHLDVRQNFARIGSDEIDRLFDEANRELDRAKAIDIANHIDTLIWQEVHSLTTYQRPEIIAVKKNLVNFGAFGFADPWKYEDIGWAKP